jgi:hypothetical protein
LWCWCSCVLVHIKFSTLIQKVVHNPISVHVCYKERKRNPQRPHYTRFLAKLIHHSRDYQFGKERKRNPQRPHHARFHLGTHVRHMHNIKVFNGCDGSCCLCLTSSGARGAKAGPAAPSGATWTLPPSWALPFTAPPKFCKAYTALRDSTSTSTCSSLATPAAPLKLARGSLAKPGSALAALKTAIDAMSPAPEQKRSSRTSPRVSKRFARAVWAGRT